jgi:26S proteasome regulatory subunit N3
VKKLLLSWLPEATPVETMDVDPAPTPSKSPVPEPVPECEIYFRLLLIHHLLANAGTQAKAMELANDSVAKVQALNRRSMDPIAAKIWYAVERTYEIVGELSEARPYV